MKPETRMTATSKVTISLIGPYQSGKTIILPSLVKALDNDGHGYPQKMGMKLKVVDDEMDGLSPQQRFVNRLERGSRFENFENKAAALKPDGETLATEATSLDTLDTFLFELTYQSPKSKLPERCEFSVMDAAGETIFPLRDSGETKFGKRQEVVQTLADSTGVVILFTFSQLRKKHYRTQLVTLFSDLVAISSRLERVVIALNKYDLLFMDCANDSWLCAGGDPHIAGNIMRRFVREHGNLKKLLDYDKSRGGPLDIRFVPTSSFGFLPSFGCPNVMARDLQALQNDFDLSPFLDEERAGESVEYVEYHPFLTADPFIFAATGLSNPFIFPIADILGGGEAYTPNASEDMAEPSFAADRGFASESQAESSAGPERKSKPKLHWLKELLPR